jgi:putative DNA primase/helicase
MADFELWAGGLRKGLWPAGTFTRAYSSNRKAVVEGIIDADPIATCVRQLMSERKSWTGCAADLLRVSLERTGQSISTASIGWPKNPRVLAGRLRRAQTFLKAIGIEIAFSREGRAGNRVITLRSCFDDTVGSVSTVSSLSENATQPQVDVLPHRYGLG